MPRRVATEDWDDRDREDDFDAPDDDWEPDEDEFDEADKDDDGTDPCPYCGEPIHYETVRCPHCERYISEEEAPAQAKPTWIAFTAVVCLIVVIVYWVMRGG